MKNYKSLKDLTNKVVLITGASGGLGEQIAYQVAKKGAIVVACARLKWLYFIHQRNSMSNVLISNYLG